jgi:hypothetical protein
MTVSPPLDSQMSDPHAAVIAHTIYPRQQDSPQLHDVHYVAPAFQPDIGANSTTTAPVGNGLRAVPRWAGRHRAASLLQVVPALRDGNSGRPRRSVFSTTECRSCFARWLGQSLGDAPVDNAVTRETPGPVSSGGMREQSARAVDCRCLACASGYHAPR